MAYNKTSEERKWNYWKEQEEKKLRELGMEEEKIQKLRQMDREDFLEERRYREHLDETMQDMDSIKEKDSELFARDVKELLDFYTATDNLIGYGILIASREYSKFSIFGNLCKVCSLNLFRTSVSLHICTL